MKSTDIFPGKYLRAADLDGREPIVTIDRVEVETLGDDSKPVMYFTGKEKGLVMNKTNWSATVEITDEEDSDDWAGHKVKLVTRKVEFQGKRVPAIRIEEAGTSAALRKTAPEPEAERVEDDDEIPFAWLLPLVLPAIAVLGAVLA
jgi:hypothetical protein